MGVNPTFFVRCSSEEVLKGLNDQVQEKDLELWFLSRRKYPFSDKNKVLKSLTEAGFKTQISVWHILLLR